MGFTMRGSLWIYTLLVVPMLLQRQSMNVYAASDPCAVNKGGCSHFCESNSSSYGCACPTGFSLGQDNKTCESKRVEPTQDSRRIEKSPVLEIVLGSLIALILVVAIIVGCLIFQDSRRSEKSPFHRRSEKFLVHKNGVGSLIALIVVVAIIVGGFRFKARKTRHVTEENMGHDNLAYGQRMSLPDDEFDKGLLTIRCSSLRVLLNGNKTGCTNITSEPHDAHCNFSFNVGYSLVGSPIRRCLENGTRSGETSNCQAITCPPLETPKGAIILKNVSCNNTYGSKCVFICKAGFVFTWKERKAANVTTTCLQSGNWSGSPINCTEKVEPTLGLATVVISEIVVFVITTGYLYLDSRRSGRIALILVVAYIVGFKARKPRHVTEENMGHDNLSYGQRRSLPEDEFNMGLFKPVQQPDVGGLRITHIHPRGHFLTSDNPNKRPDNPPFSGAIVSQSEIENEGNVMDSPNYSDETLNNHLPTSFPKYITLLEDTFTSTGGELCAPLESDVRIIVPSSAIPAGINQSVFFGVVLDETTLLRDVPESPDCTLISPVIECGPHEIHLLKPVEIIVPHCLDLKEAKKEWITVYRCGQFFAQDYLTWEKVPNESEEANQSSQAVFTVKGDVIHIKTKIFSLWSIFACGGPRRKRATVFANRPDLKSDLIYLRFYVYSDNRDSKKRVELAEKERFPGSKPSREKPFTMYKDSRVITVKLTDLQEGWNFDKTKNTQIYKCGKARGSGFRSTDACDFAVKPEDGQDVEGFRCNVKFQQEDDDQEHSIYLNPGFTPLKRQRTRQSSLEGDRSDSTSSTSQAWDHYVSTLGSEQVTEEHIYQISLDVGRDWKDVLRNLSMKEKAIENLSEDHKYEKITEQCIQGLLKWKELEPDSATIKILAGALLRARCFDALQKLQNSIG